LFLVDDQIPLIKRDADGRLILNVFNHFWRPADIESPDAIVGDHWGGSADEEGLMLVRSALEDALSRAETRDANIREKVRWVVRQFNETLQDINTSKLSPFILD
jgi:hypothetical protein